MKSSLLARPLAILIIVCGMSLTAPAERLPRTNLLVYHNPNGVVRPVESKRDWEQRRAEILRGFAKVAGELPDREAKWCELEVQITEVEDCGSYERQLISYQSEPGSRVPAYLCLPKRALTGGKNFPAVLCLHPTDMKYGHRSVVETVRDYYRAYAHDLATRGFVTIAPAYPLMANFQPDLERLGWSSGTLKAVWDNQRALDVLDALSFVNHRGYGVIGHSLGGHNALFTAAQDSRLKVVISSCGFDAFPDYYGGDPQRWAPGQGWAQTRYMPGLSDYRHDLGGIPFDFPELLGVLAPRMVFISAPLDDSNFRASSVDDCVRAARPIYQLYRAPGNLRVVHPSGGHDFPAPVREQAYRLLAEQLR